MQACKFSWVIILENLFFVHARNPHSLSMVSRLMHISVTASSPNWRHSGICATLQKNISAFSWQFTKKNQGSNHFGTQCTSSYQEASSNLSLQFFLTAAIYHTWSASCLQDRESPFLGTDVPVIFQLLQCTLANSWVACLAEHLRFGHKKQTVPYIHGMQCSHILYLWNQF